MTADRASTELLPRFTKVVAISVQPFATTACDPDPTLSCRTLPMILKTLLVDTGHIVIVKDVLVEIDQPSTKKIRMLINGMGLLAPLVKWS